MHITRILLPVDGSAVSLRAARDAAWLARNWGAELLLLHCNTVFPNLKRREDYAREVAEAANKVLGPVRDILQDYGIRYMERVEDDSPAETIPRLAAREGVDLIVMGSRGAGPLEGALLGSVTQQVLHAAKCRVLVVP